MPKKSRAYLLGTPEVIANPELVPVDELPELLGNMPGT
jgi:hypothetical protein